MKNSPRVIASLFAAVTLATASGQEAGFDHSHAAFTGVLKSVVRNQRVDYSALTKGPAALDAYLDSLAAVPEESFKSWSKNQRLAFLINLYNAATLKLVADRYPVKSIKDIGSFLKGPWDQPVVRAFGKKLTLNHIEHEIIRKQYGEPRSHFGLVCASIGCPPLRSEAFNADKLSEQLDEQGRLFFATASKNQVDAGAGILYLSPIFNWFAEDFATHSGTIEKFVAPYFADEADQRAVASGKLSVKYTDYDWSLNQD